MDTDTSTDARKQEEENPYEQAEEVMVASGLTKRFGHVVALNNANFSLRRGEILAVIGDNGAGKSTLIKCLSGAHIPDEGQITIEGQSVNLRSPQHAREVGIETVYQDLAVSPALDISSNLYLGRELKKPGLLGQALGVLDRKRMRTEAADQLSSLGVQTVQDISQQVEALSGGQRQAVAVARAAVFGTRVVIMDEPTAALGVKESRRVLNLINEVRNRGCSVVLISHNMPHVFEIADRIHVQRLGSSAGILYPHTHSMDQAVAVMTGAVAPADLEGADPVFPGTGW